MGTSSRARDLIGAILLVLVGLLYMTGISRIPEEHAGSDEAVEVEMLEGEVPLVESQVLGLTS